MKRLQPQPPHTQGTFQCRLQPLHTEKRMVSCSGFLPKTIPMRHSCSHYNAFCSIANRVANLHVSTHMTTQDDNNHAAIQMRFATTGSRNAKNYAHMNNIEQPHVAEHQGRTDSTMKRSQPQPPHTHKVPLSAACSHLTRKNTRFGAPASSPTQAPCNIHAAITMRFAASRGKPACIYAYDNTR